MGSLFFFITIVLLNHGAGESKYSFLIYREIKGVIWGKGLSKKTKVPLSFPPPAPPGGREMTDIIGFLLNQELLQVPLGFGERSAERGFRGN